MAIQSSYISAAKSPFGAVIPRCSDGRKPELAEPPCDYDSDGPSDAYLPSVPPAPNALATSSRNGGKEAVAAAGGAMPGFPLQIVLIGPDGAGKTTQAERLAEDFGLEHFQVDQLIEAEVSSGSRLGRSASWYVTRGLDVPSKVVYQVIDSRLGDYEGGFVLDGLPGSGLKEESLQSLLKKDQFSNLQVVGLEVGGSVVADRLKLTGYQGEGELNAYEEKSQDQVDFFINEGRYSVVDGDGSVEEVNQRLHECVEWLVKG